MIIRKITRHFWRITVLLIVFALLEREISDLNVGAQIIQNDATDELIWQEWTDGLIVKRGVISDTEPETIELDTVIDDFDVDWASYPDYFINITYIIAIDGNDASDTIYGIFYDVDDNGLPFDQPIAPPHQVNHTQGWIQWAPQNLDHEQNIRVYFEVVSPNSTKKCMLLIQRYQDCIIPPLKDVNGSTVFPPPVPDCRIQFD